MENKRPCVIDAPGGRSGSRIKVDQGVTGHVVTSSHTHTTLSLGLPDRESVRLKMRDNVKVTAFELHKYKKVDAMERSLVTQVAISRAENSRV